MSNAMYLCYHHNDMDGKGAGNEVYKYILNSGIQPVQSMFIMRGYDEPFSEQDYEGKIVFIVDLSFTMKSIRNLFDICEKANKVVWIDHHKSSIECLQNDDIRTKLDGYKNLKYFVNNQACGTLLTHLYCTGFIPSKYENAGYCTDYQIEYDVNTLVCRVIDGDFNEVRVTIPLHIILIDQWDRWVYGEDMRPVHFNYGCGMRNTSLFAYNTKTDTVKTYNRNFWNALQTRTFINKVCNEGFYAKKYADGQSRRTLSASSYECDILGHKALVVNSPGNSDVFGKKIKDYDLVCIWTYNGKLGLYQYSFYSDNKSIDCAALAQKFNPSGGGHQSAAGFSSDKLLFKKN